MLLASLAVPAALVGSTYAAWAPPKRWANDTPTYKDASACVEDRIADLLPRMSLAEKVSQLTQGDYSRYINLSTTDLTYNATALDFEMSKRGGQIWTGTPNKMNREKLVWAINLAQKYLMENTTLGIPAIHQTEALHGFIDMNGTIFPSPLAMGASFNVPLVKKVGERINYETVALGIAQLFAPVLDLALDPRFGRVEEGFGECHYLTGEMGLAFVEGIQGVPKMGAASTATVSSAATCKHLLAYGSNQGGLNVAPVDGGERQLRSVYTRAFHKACMGSLSMMSAYSSYDGVPAVSDYHVLTEILRDEWDYKYFVTSDAGAVDLLMTTHGTAASREECAKAVVENGLSAEMGGGTYTFFTLEDQVRAGTVNESYIDRAVSYMLRAKFDLGLFENPYAYSNWTDYTPDNTVTKEVHHDIEVESIVLLKNENSVLPIKAGSRIALIGPQAGQPTLGDYVFPGADEHTVTPLAGFQALANQTNTTITYSDGCLRWSNDDSMFAEAVAAAEASDVAVVMVGTWSRNQVELWQGLNATTGEHVDMADLGLVGAQLALVKAVQATNKPTVVVFVSGKPVSEPWIAENVDAVVQQFYGGFEQGNAIAEILLGLSNPSGKLPMSVARDVGTLPAYYNYLKGARPLDAGREYDNGTLVFGHEYVLNSPVPLWSFGHGLSYSNFTYNSLTLGAQNVSKTADVPVTISVTNQGSRDGLEAVQLYYRDVVSSVVTPVLQLAGVQKVYIPAGQTVSVNMTLQVPEMALWNQRNEWVVEAGEFQLFTGAHGSVQLSHNASLYVV